MLKKLESVKIPLLISFIFIIFMSIFAYFKYYNFYDTFDLAVFNNLYFRFSNGLGFSSSLHNVSKLSIHFRPFLFFIYPIYLLFKTPEFFIYFQIICVGLSIIPLYYISEKILNNRQLSLLICIIYALYPPLINVTLYPFHP